MVGDLGGGGCADGCGGRWGLRGRELECGVMVVCVFVLSALDFVTWVYLRGFTVRGCSDEGDFFRRMLSHNWGAAPC